MFGVIQAFVLAAGLVHGASLQSVADWGSNPSNIKMSIYVPDQLASRPPVVVALHGCGGSGQQMFSSAQFHTYANQYGFILIYPSSNTNQGMACWDNHSAKSLTHDGGSDTQGIVQQVRYTLNKYNGDASRVYAVGFSSGAMMTNNLAATYPDVFEAGASFAGVPAACFAGSSGSTPISSNTSCAAAEIIKSAQEWGNFARNAYAGYSGRRTRMQIWHGAADSLVLPQLFHEQLKQWSNVLGVSLTGTNSNTPETGYTRHLYGDGSKLVGYLAAGAGHGGVPFHESMVLNFFGVLTTPPTSTTASRTPTTTPTTTTKQNPGTSTITPGPTTPAGGYQSKWGQCGGMSWTGYTACSPPAACTTLNPYYAQCL